MNPTQSLRAAPATPAPPTDRVVKCALSDCESTFRITDSYNFVITMMKRGPDPRLAGFQCPDPAEIAAGNLEAQHFCCSPEHALMAAFLCARDHIIPQHVAEVAALAQADAAEAQRHAKAQALIAASHIDDGLFQEVQPDADEAARQAAQKPITGGRS